MNLTSALSSLETPRNRSLLSSNVRHALKGMRCSEMTRQDATLRIVRTSRLRIATPRIVPKVNRNLSVRSAKLVICFQGW